MLQKMTYIFNARAFDMKSSSALATISKHALEEAQLVAQLAKTDDLDDLHFYEGTLFCEKLGEATSSSLLYQPSSLARTLVSYIWVGFTRMGILAVSCH